MATGVPTHVAFIMDGNRRWATERGLLKVSGYDTGFQTMLRVGRFCYDSGVQVVSCYVWSTENWSRPKSEVRYIMMQFEQRMPSLIDELCQLGVRFVHSGLREGLSTTALQRIDDAVRLTRDYTSPVFNLAFNYGFRAEVVNAVRNIIYDQVDPDTIDETVFGSYLWSHDLPDVDLVIRTGNDHRFSNYLLWQSAHANIYVVDKYWPELHESDVSTAFDCWSARTDAS